MTRTSRGVGPFGPAAVENSRIASAGRPGMRLRWGADGRPATGTGQSQPHPARRADRSRRRHRRRDGPVVLVGIDFVLVGIDSAPATAGFNAPAGADHPTILGGAQAADTTVEEQVSALHRRR
jgi:hypothetical protein